MWRIEVALPEGVPIAPFEAAIAQNDGAVAVTRGDDGGWRLAAYAETMPDRRDLAARIAVAAAAVGSQPPEAAIEPVPDIDWVSHVHALTPPIEAGRFHVHGSHVADPVPVGRIGILIDAGPAFGTGEHQSTRGCLIALDRLAEQPAVARVLDLGCGSGILSVAAAKIWPAEITAADSDADAVAMTRRAARANGVGARVTAVKSLGFQNARIRGRAPFDLILANILARPLVRLAAPIARHLAPGGRVVLSGLLEEHGPVVLGAYRKQGLEEVERIVLDEWLTLLLSEPAKRD